MNRPAFLLGVAMVLLGNLVAVALRTYAESVFLAAYGAARLPWLLIASAGGFAAATIGYHRITRGGSTRVVDLALLVVLGASAVTAPALLAGGVSPIALVIALTAASQVAGLALWNRVAATVAGRDARRMLPRAGAAVTAGGVIAGLGAGVVIPRAGLDAIPYIGAIVTVAVLALTIAQARALSAGAPGAVAPAGSADVLGVVQRRLVVALVAVAVLEAVVATVADLQFAAALKDRYDDVARPVAIALFLGGTNAILLVLQLAAVPRLLVTRSLPFTAAIHPLFVIGWYAAVVLAAGFVPVAGTRTADQVLRTGTSRAAQELALSALPPGPRARWKVLLRGVMFPAGALAAAFALLASGPVALAHPAKLAAVAITVAVAWAIVARVAARRFQAALAAPLGIRAARKLDARRIDLDTLERWTAAAGGEDAAIAALARSALAVARVDTSDLADHLRHDDAAVRTAMLDQLARAPVPGLRAELRAAVAIEDDDRALALAIKALAIAGDDGGLARGVSRAALSREVADTVRTAELALRGGDILAELDTLCTRDPGWAAAILRGAAIESPGFAGARSDAERRGGSIDEAALATRLLQLAGTAATRAGALLVIARVGPPAALAALDAALAADEPAARHAIAELDADGASFLAAHVAALSARGRLAIARALATAPAASAVLEAMLADRDPEVAYATLRSALAIARGGGTLASASLAGAYEAARAALVAHLDARDDDATHVRSACARAELAHATARGVARLMWAAAVEAAAAGRDPSPLAATARHLASGGEAERKRALDVAQELAAGRVEILAVIERWLRPPDPSTTEATPAQLSAHDPWLARLLAGELAALEPTLVALRRPALFAAIAGPALAELAERATPRRIDGTLFAIGDAGDTMFVVATGSLVAQRPGTPDRTIAEGGVVGEVAVLSHAPRAATVRAGDGGADVLVIDRAAFVVAAHRAPELVLGLAATLAGWLAPNRPDVL